jgi:hypothetical protein
MAIKARAMRELRRATTVALRDRQKLDEIRRRSWASTWRLHNALGGAVAPLPTDAPVRVYLAARRQHLLDAVSNEHSNATEQIQELDR